MHSQNLGCSRHVSLSVLEAPADVASLKLSPILSKICREWHSQAVIIRTCFPRSLRESSGYLSRQIVTFQFVAFGHDYRSVHRIFQLAHVSRPFVIH
jgi:hypothetical protein